MRSKDGRSVKVRGAACGIDLGTTNSAVAVVGEDGVPSLVRFEESAAIPSILVVSSDCKLAHSSSSSAKRHCLFAFKRYIGREFASLSSDEASQMPFSVDADPSSDGTLLSTRGCSFSPDEASRVMLQHLISVAESSSNLSIDRAVVGVPAHFTESQRESTRDAALAAGLTSVQLLREPVAAALAYSVDVQDDQTVLVVDLGGGTFDVSVLEVGGGAVEVLSHSGDSRLGGTDFDWAIASMLARKARHSEERPASLLQVARHAREALSSNEEAGVFINEKRLVSKRDLEQASDRATLLRDVVRVSNDELERECSDLLNRMSGPIEEAALASGIELGIVQDLGGEQSWGEKRNVDEVLLVGGATRMRAVQRFVSSLSGTDASLGEEVEPEAVVAVGAALRAATLQGFDTGLESYEPLQAELMRQIAKSRIERGELQPKEEQLVDEEDSVLMDEEYVIEDEDEGRTMYGFE